MSDSYYYKEGGTWAGKYTAEQLVELARCCRISPETLIKRNSDGKQFLAGTVKRLFPDEKPRPAFAGGNSPNSKSHVGSHGTEKPAPSHVKHAARENSPSIVSKRLWIVPILLVSAGLFLLVTFVATVWRANYPIGRSGGALQPDDHSSSMIDAVSDSGNHTPESRNARKPPPGDSNNSSPRILEEKPAYSTSDRMIAANENKVVFRNSGGIYSKQLDELTDDLKGAAIKLAARPTNSQYPSRVVLSLSDARSRARNALGDPAIANETAGMYLATESVFEYEIALLVSGMSLSEEVYCAVIRHAVATKMINRVGSNGDKLDDYFDSASNAEGNARLAEQHSGYSDFHSTLTKPSDRKKIDKIIVDDGIEQIVNMCHSGSDLPLFSYLLETWRYQTDGPTPHNDLTPFLRGNEIVQSAQPDRGNAEIGSHVGKFGFKQLRPFIWSGKIVGRENGSWLVRVTWVSEPDVSPYGIGLEYHMTNDEFNLRSGPSVGDKLNGF